MTAYGGTVDRIAARARRGRADPARRRGVFAGLPQLFAAVRYHSLAALSLPDELVVTASDAGGDVVMGVRHVALPQEGVQFHPESILSEHGAAMVANFLEAVVSADRRASARRPRRTSAASGWTAAAPASGRVTAR